MTTKQQLVAEANAAHAHHPQYRGYWDGWEVTTAKCDVRHRGSLVLRKGQSVLVDPTSVEIAGQGDLALSRAKAGTKFVVVYLTVTHVNTVVRADKLNVKL